MVFMASMLYPTYLVISTSAVTGVYSFAGIYAAVSLCFFFFFDNKNSFTWPYIRYHLFVSIRGLVEAASAASLNTKQDS